MNGAPRSATALYGSHRVAGENNILVAVLLPGRKRDLKAGAVEHFRHDARDAPSIEFANVPLSRAVISPPARSYPGGLEFGATLTKTARETAVTFLSLKLDQARFPALT